MKIQIKKENFILHPSGAVFWEKQKTLIISDVHLGKITHFRKHGIAVPQNAVLENFRRINDVLDFFLPETILFLGDLFHSFKNTEWNLFQEWISNIPQQVVLIVGNHDIIEEKHYHEVGVIVQEEVQIESFFFTHHPTEKEGLFNFSGHIHPGIILRGLGLQSLKLRCFFQKNNQMILPAFGEFTGKYFLKPTAEDKVYVVAENEVFLIK